jgi:predicted metal-dependent enzyme (double-stranded beta helix superfamily)
LSAFAIAFRGHDGNSQASLAHPAQRLAVSKCQPIGYTENAFPLARGRNLREESGMSYTLEQFSADCRAALLKNPGPAGREMVRQFTARASSDPEFVAKYLGPDATADRKILYEDPDLHFCILAHVYRGARNSTPHDHGPSWAVYSQVAGETEMTDWRLLQKPSGGQPGKVEKVRTYKLTPGVAHLYNEGDLHSPRRDGDTRLIRIEGTDLTKVKRDKFEVAA